MRHGHYSSRFRNAAHGVMNTLIAIASVTVVILCIQVLAHVTFLDDLHSEKIEAAVKTEAAVSNAGDIFTKAVPIVTETAEPEQMPDIEAEAEPVTYDVPIDEELQLYIIGLCEERGIAPEIVFAMIDRESQYDAYAVGDGGDSLGLMQIQEKWHSERMAELGCTDLLDPYQNVTVGIDFLCELLDRYDGDLAKALTGYNQGAYRGFVTEYATGILANSETIAEAVIA